MSRRCTCSRLLAALRDDPRLVTLPLAVRMLFLLVAEAAGRAPEMGILPFSDPRRVSLLVSCSVTEAETGIETLIAEGLIRAEGGGLVVPLIRDAAALAEVARRNGSNGGRPRKGETREQALARRQGSFKMPIPGGHDEKPGETQAEKPADPPLVVVEEKKEPKPSTTTHSGDARVPEWVSLGTQVAEIAGLDGARGGFDFRPVQAWLNEGIAPDVILAAVRESAAWSGYDPRAIASLRYFDKPVHRHAARATPAAPPVPLTTPAERAEEAAACARAQARIEAHLASLSRFAAAA